MRISDWSSDVCSSDLPSTLELFHELGLLHRLPKRPHDKVSELSGRVAGREVKLADFSHLPVKCGFIAMMPQWELLDFLNVEASRYPAFSLRMNAEASDLLYGEAGRISGIRLKNGENIRARLVIAADGRHSRLRQVAALPLKDIGAPMDVFWFRLPKKPEVRNQTMGVFQTGRIFVQIDRNDYWQCAYVFPKGGADRVRGQGLAHFHDEIAHANPDLAEAAKCIRSWDDVKLLSVTLDRLTRWYAPGILAIGDAAHAMSPLGGVGINLAIQDAVAAANILAEPMADGKNPDPLLHLVQNKRMGPTRHMQSLQKLIQDRSEEHLLESRWEERCVGKEWVSTYRSWWSPSE